MIVLKNKDGYPSETLAETLFCCAQNSYQHGAPWSQSQFLNDLKMVHSEYIVLENEKTIGFLGYHHVLDEIEIFNLVVDETEKNKGYGQRLLKELVHIAEATMAEQILLEVRVSNHSAQNLYLSQGFEVIARRKDYYQAPVEDALIMVRKVNK